MLFQCRVGDARGDITILKLEALDKDNLVRELVEKKYFIFEITPLERKEFFLISTIRNYYYSTNGYFGYADLIDICDELRTMLDAGLSLTKAIEIIAFSQKVPQKRDIILQIKRDMEFGNSLSSAIKRQKDAGFPAYFHLSIMAGEESGKLSEVLSQLIRLFKIEKKVRSKFILSMVYPAILFLVSSIILGFLLVRVVPRFAENFNNLGIELPDLTRWVMKTSDFIIDRGVLIAAVSGYVLLQIIKYRNTEKGRLHLDGILLKLPAFSKMIYYTNIIRFYKILSTLISSGMPIVTACDIARNSLSNKELIAKLDRISSLLRSGIGFSLTMGQIGLFPIRDVQMMKIGEESGQLDYIFSNLSESYYENMDALVSSVMVIIEVLFILLVGIFIAVIVIAMYLPMFAMWQHSGGM